MENRERDSLTESLSATWQSLKGCGEMTWSKWDPVLASWRRAKEVRGFSIIGLGPDDRPVEIGVESCLGRPGKVRPNATGIFPETCIRC